MRMVLALAALLLVSSPLAAEEVLQTDWCGGNGIPGPVADWANQFDSSAGVSWMSVQGQLALSSSALASPGENLITDVHAGTIGVAVGDIDGDGDTDVVGTADASGVVVFWENEGGDPVTWTEHTVTTPPGAAGVDVADIDGDGRLDIVVTCDDPRNRILWRQNLGGDPITWGGAVIQNPWSDAWEISTGDVDGDGHMDVLCTHWSERDVAWWRNDGGDPITWTRNDVDTDLRGAHSVRGADLDDDGDFDVAVAAGVADEIAVYWSDGGDPITWTKQVLDTTFTGARSVWIDDIDQDGDLDLAGICWESDLAWWRNDGGDPVVWVRQTISTDCGGGHALCIADLNGDNRPDVLGACYLAGKMSWWENGGGDSISWTEHVLDQSAHRGPITVRVADLDGDGDLDPVGALYSTGKYVWWEATGFDSSGELTASILDTGAKSGLGSVDWTALDPVGTSLRFQVRSSNDPGDLGSWSADIMSPGNLPGLLDRYIQYRVFLETADADESPILEEISFGLPSAAVEIMDSAVRIRPLAIRPNPFNPQATISFGLEAAGRVNLVIFDAAGRRVRQLANHVFPAGDHHLSWDGVDDYGRALQSGVYFVRMESPSRKTSEKLILLR